jgi:hypothetical protein
MGLQWPGGPCEDCLLPILRRTRWQQSVGEDSDSQQEILDYSLQYEQATVLGAAASDGIAW